MRSDNGFQNNLLSNHHEGVSPLLSISMGLVTQIPLDYMHLVCLGVMRKLLLVWSCGKHKLSRSDLNLISERMINLQKFVPKEFARRPRGL